MDTAQHTTTQWTGEEVTIAALSPEIIMFILFDAGRFILNLLDVLSFARTARWAYNVSLGDSYGRMLARTMLPVQTNASAREWKLLAFSDAQGWIEKQEIQSALESVWYHFEMPFTLWFLLKKIFADPQEALDRRYKQRRRLSIAASLARLMNKYLVSLPLKKGGPFSMHSHVCKALAYLVSYLTPKAVQSPTVVDTLRSLYDRAIKSWGFCDDPFSRPAEDVQYFVVRILVKLRMYVAVREFRDLGFMSEEEAFLAVDVAVPGDVDEAEAILDLIEGGIVFSEQDRAALVPRRYCSMPLLSSVRVQAHAIAAILWCGSGGEIAIDEDVFQARLAPRILDLFSRLEPLMNNTFKSHLSNRQPAFTQVGFWNKNVVFLAAHWASDACWKLLLDAGLRERIDEPLQWEAGSVQDPGTPLCIAAAALSPLAVSRLLDAGANVNTKMGGTGRTPLEDIGWRAAKKITPPSRLCATERTTITALLVQHGARSSHLGAFGEFDFKRHPIGHIPRVHDSLLFTPSSYVPGSLEFV